MSASGPRVKESAVSVVQLRQGTAERMRRYGRSIMWSKIEFKLLYAKDDKESKLKVTYQNDSR